MKKILLIIAGLILIPSICFGAGSSATIVKDTGGTLPHGSRIITCLFVADDTDGSFPDLTLNVGGTTFGMYTGITGWKFFKVKVFGNHAVTHTGADDAAVLTDSTGGFNLLTTLVGYTLTNTTDSSSGTITANTSTTITATLTGGENDWDTDDVGLWGVESTTNSEIYVFMDGDDILNGYGVNAVDNDANNEIPAYVGDLPAAITITNDLVIRVTQQAAATVDAIVVVQLELYK